MSLKNNLQKRFFPSYGKIHQNILNQHKKEHEQKVTELQGKISALKQAFNLENEHEQIKKKLLQNYHSTNHQYLKTIFDSLNNEEQKLQKQSDNTLWNTRSSTSTYGNTVSNAYSLNYCIDDDMQEDNHYENHLKFKKQVLERDLFQNTYYRNDKKKHHDQQYIFKNLYNPRPNTAFELNGSENLKVRRPLKKNYVLSDNNKEFKENIKQFKKYSPKQPKKVDLRFNKFLAKKKQANQKLKKQFQSSALKKCLRKQQNEDQFLQQHDICQKNTKILKDSYGRYLKQLQGTNIIKWRILGGQKQKQKELINLSINLSGIGISDTIKNDKLMKE